ncbi:hypothetical protein GLAREA_00400 [Glarea lozoyensis ATCC 20868]|uniref:Uncharacterized protein n=1 Tax=Glarea lozoyensis (strain ATCC 20868 / MF5171) TaxID=1116229 RepID=S3CUC6_GLAL2|nr:uncharacterized protein GLAREA_00400 [Glarea lozoyensis ATCC 20868]EPE29240.1 hypothetical protein GLAREA_00400 [Glarea lozoyensis ATCC 20868]
MAMHNPPASPSYTTTTASTSSTPNTSSFPSSNLASSPITPTSPSFKSQTLLPKPYVPSRQPQAPVSLQKSIPQKPPANPFLPSDVGLPKLEKRISNGSKVENWLGATQDVKVEDLSLRKEETRKVSPGVGVHKRFSISERFGRGDVGFIFFQSLSIESAWVMEC